MNNHFFEFYASLVRKASGNEGQKSNLDRAFKNFGERLLNGKAFVGHGLPNTLSVKGDDPGRYLDVEFLGRTFRFVYSVQLAEGSSTLEGVVRYYLLEEIPEPESVEKGHFTFNEVGVSSIPQPETTVGLNVAQSLEAMAIVMTCILKALEAKKPT